VAAGAEEHWIEDYCRVMVSGLLPEHATEFGSLLWEKASELCVFVDQGEKRVLRAYGRGAEQVITGVLEDSPRPLHYSEIAGLASARAGRPVDPRRAHNAAAQVGLLFGSGTYGPRKHLKLSAAEMQAFAQAAEDLILEGGLERQWHCGEIVELLSERSQEVVPNGADRYHLDIAFKERRTLRGLGRMVWAVPGALSEASRLEVRETILTTLRMAGRPLKAEEIRQRVCAVRGVGQHFQIIAADPLVKIGPALWGLNDRDISIKRDSQPFMLEEIVRLLQRRGTGVHISEMEESLDVGVTLVPAEIFGLYILESRLAVSPGQYLYLREWGEPRRETIAGAVRSIMLDAIGSPVPVDVLAATAAKRIGRSVERSLVYGALQSIGARMIGPSTWQYTSEEIETEDTLLKLPEEGEASGLFGS
jgi:hypothetical protein